MLLRKHLLECLRTCISSYQTIAICHEILLPAKHLHHDSGAALPEHTDNVTEILTAALDLCRRPRSSWASTRPGISTSRSG